MRQKIQIIIILIILGINSYGFFDDFDENPAQLGTRQFGYLLPPLFWAEGGFANSNLSIGDLGMFEEGHELTNSEIDILTSDDLNFNLYSRFTLLSFGYKNWELTNNSYIRGYLGDFDKEFMEFTFEGNEAGKYYKTSAMSNTYLYQFVKTRFSWSYPQGLSFSSLPGIQISNKNSGGFMVKLEQILNYMREMDIYLGANLNLYNSFGYAEVAESHQEFVSGADSLYTYNRIKYIYSDPDEVTSRSTSFGLGLGMKMALPNGWFHFSLDDLGGKLKYSDLLYSEMNSFHLDYLNFLDEEHEAIDESDEIEEEPYEGYLEVKLAPSVTVGLEYDLGKGFSAMAKYRNCDYMLDGFFMGTTYRPLDWLPINLNIGLGGVDSFNFKFGVDHGSFAILFGMTNYNGLFNGAKGYGGDLGVKFKF